MRRNAAPGFFSLQLRWWSFLSAAEAATSAATLLGFLGPLWWGFDLFSHFRVQYLLGLGILAVVLLLGGRWKAAAIFFVMAAVNLPAILPLYLGRTDAAPSTRVLRVMLINVNTSSGDPTRVRQAVEAADPDFLVLEEVSARWMSELGWLQASHPHSVVEPREDNFGIALFSKLPFGRSDVLTIGSAGVPSLSATAATKGGELRLLATHPVPPSGADYAHWRDEQLALLPAHIDASVPFLLIGDLNTTPWNHHFRRLLATTGLIDSSRGRGVQPTWPNFTFLLRLPIDHVLHSPSITVHDKTIGSDVGSDHFPVVVDFSLSPPLP